MGLADKQTASLVAHRVQLAEGRPAPGRGHWQFLAGLCMCPAAARSQHRAAAGAAYWQLPHHLVLAGFLHWPGGCVVEASALSAGARVCKNACHALGAVGLG